MTQNTDLERAQNDFEEALTAARDFFGEIPPERLALWADCSVAEAEAAMNHTSADPALYDNITEAITNMFEAYDQYIDQCNDVIGSISSCLGR